PWPPRSVTTGGRCRSRPRRRPPFASPWTTRPGSCSAPAGPTRRRPTSRSPATPRPPPRSCATWPSRPDAPRQTSHEPRRLPTKRGRSLGSCDAEGVKGGVSPSAGVVEARPLGRPVVEEPHVRVDAVVAVLALDEVGLRVLPRLDGVVERHRAVLDRGGRA